MIELIEVSKSFGSKKLFENFTLRIGAGERVALVGPNGCGKSTIFSIIVGNISPDSGRVEMKKGLNIGYLPQEVFESARSDFSLLEYCVRNARGIGALLEEKTMLEDKVSQGGAEQGQMERILEVEDALNLRGFQEIWGEAERVLLGLGFSLDDLRCPTSTLSGGLLMRGELARLLLDRPDCLLLDEPLNHLDLEGILFLEDFVRSFDGAVVFVAHDREFINRVAQKVVEVTKDGAVTYKGRSGENIYDRYKQEREKAIELAWKRFEEQQARIKEIEEFIARNRVRKDRAQVVQSRIKMLEKMERLEPPEPVRRVKFKFPQPPRAPEIVLSLEDVGHAYGDKWVFRHIFLSLRRGEKAALVGVNGAGKTTLLRICAGVVAPSQGKRVLAENVSVGYFSQDQLEVLRSDRTVLENMMEVADSQTVSFVRPILGAFLFGDDDIDKKVCVLSGGERARLALSRLLLRPKALLVMDEPTNHLDIASREVLETALKEYEGTVLFVSHDRKFMDNVATCVLELKDGNLTRFEGNYSYYASKIAGAQSESTQAKRGIEGGAKIRREQEKQRRREEAQRRNLVYAMMKPLKEKVAQIEAKITSIEEELRQIEAELVLPDLYKDTERAIALTQRAKELRKTLDGLYEEWSMAADELQQISR
jgi:ATP-binding cassette subfamily F protein 3